MLQPLVLLAEAVDHLVPVQRPDNLEYLTLKVLDPPWRYRREFDPYHPVRVYAVIQLRIDDISLKDDSRDRVIGTPPEDSLLQAVVLHVHLQGDEVAWRQRDIDV